MTARVTHIVREKGYAFAIAPTGETIFLHRSECKDFFGSLRVDDHVAFTPVTSEKGVRARDAVLITEGVVSDGNRS